MGLDQGLPWMMILRWTYEQMDPDPDFRDVRLDEAMQQIFFTVRARHGVERRYRLTIDRGWPRVDQVEGPPETVA
jgi:hypothetical protein